MKVTSSYAVHVQDHRQSLKATVSLYRAAVAFMIDVVDKEWDTLPPICAAGGKLGQHALEHMIHKTKGFPKPKYNFDEKFYLCRRKTLCFSCRDIRRHPCPCANTRANISKKGASK